MCINTENNIEKEKSDTEWAKSDASDLETRKAELESWQQQEKQRREQEEIEKRQKELDEANFCTCGPWMCKLNDKSICWRKCCNNEYGGPPPTRAPEVDMSKDPLSAIPGYIPANAATGEKA